MTIRRQMMLIGNNIAQWAIWKHTIYKILHIHPSSSSIHPSIQYVILSSAYRRMFFSNVHIFLFVKPMMGADTILATVIKENWCFLSILDSPMALFFDSNILVSYFFFYLAWPNKLLLMSIWHLWNFISTYKLSIGIYIKYIHNVFYTSIQRYVFCLFLFIYPYDR